jgi:ribonuclease P protein component
MPDLTDPAPPAADAPPAAPALILGRMRRRADFLKAAAARRQGTPGFLIQGRDRGDTDPPRVGFTCSKKVGNAVARNRAKRRLREVARLALAPVARAGWDYVLVGRPQATEERDFSALLAEAEAAVARLHGGGR